MWLWRLGEFRRQAGHSRKDLQFKSRGGVLVNKKASATDEVLKPSVEDSFLLWGDQLFSIQAFSQLDEAYPHYEDQPVLFKVHWLKCLIQKHPHRNLQDNVSPNIWALRSSHSDTCNQPSQSSLPPQALTQFFTQ